MRKELEETKQFRRKWRKESEGVGVVLEEKEVNVEEEKSRGDYSGGECSLTKSICERV